MKRCIFKVLPSVLIPVSVFACVYLAAFAGEPKSPKKDKPAKVKYYLPYKYGETYRVWQGNNQGSTHKHPQTKFAWDFKMAEGTPLAAVADGVVYKIKENEGELTGKSKDANHIWIRHADRLYSQYIHIKYNGVIVELRQKVFAGEVIGYSGNTGMSSGPHLHFCWSNGRVSVPCKFEDVGGNGKPVKGDRPKSGNYPVRKCKAYIIIQTSEKHFKILRELGCIEAISRKMKSLKKIKVGMPSDVPASKKDVVLKKRDELLGKFEEAAARAWEEYRKIKKAGDLKDTVRMAVLGAGDFYGSEKHRDFKDALAELTKLDGFKEAKAALKSEIEYRKKIKLASRKEQKLDEKEAVLRAGGKPSKKKPKYSGVIKQYEKALPLAPSGEMKERLSRHITDLKAK